MAGKLQEYRATFEGFLRDKTYPWTRWLDRAEAKTGVDRSFLATGAIVFIALYLVFGFGSGLVCNIIAFVYPAYMSMKALESPQKDDDTKWLTYWVVFAIFSIFEYFSDFIVGWFPLYWLMKCLFVIWCFNPTEYNGSLIVYRRLIRPYYHKHHGRVDQIAESDAKELMKRISRKLDKSIDKVGAKLDNTINRGIEVVGKKLDKWDKQHKKHDF